MNSLGLTQKELCFVKTVKCPKDFCLKRIHINPRQFQTKPTLVLDLDKTLVYTEK